MRAYGGILLISNANIWTHTYSIWARARTCARMYVFVCDKDWSSKRKIKKGKKRKKRTGHWLAGMHTTQWKWAVLVLISNEYLLKPYKHINKICHYSSLSHNTDRIAMNNDAFMMQTLKLVNFPHEVFKYMK